MSKSNLQPDEKSIKSHRLKLSIGPIDASLLDLPLEIPPADLNVQISRKLGKTSKTNEQRLQAYGDTKPARSVLETRGRPSTWLPRGSLVEPLYTHSRARRAIRCTRRL